MIRTQDGDSTTTYTYDVENRLIGVTDEEDSWTNTFDAIGNRIEVNSNGNVTQFFYDPVGFGNVVGEYDASSQLTRTSVHGFGLIGQFGTTDTYFTYDALGSTADITDANGVSQGHYTYSPFGELLTPAADINARSLFVGELGITGADDLWSMRARSYDAELGRFTQRDPIGLLAGDVNFYRYVGNAATAFTDPLGLQSFEASAFGGWNGHGAYGAINISPTGTVTFTGGTGFGFGGSAGVGPSTSSPSPGSSSGYTGAVGVMGLPPWYPSGASVTVTPTDPSIDGSVSWGAGVGGFIGPTTTICVYGCGPGTSPQSADAYYCVGEGCTLKPWPGPTDPANPGGSSDSAYGVDPNEKTGPTGYGDDHYVASDATLPYKIEFENYEEAPAPAQRVDIVDQLSADFDWDTFELTSVAFGDLLIPIPNGPKFYRTTLEYEFDGVPFQVEIELGIRRDTGLVYAQFLSIDSTTGLPPSAGIGFLPQENGTGRGQGYFTYNIKPKAGLPSGHRITNVAEITFDRGETIATDQIDPHDPSQGTDPELRAPVTIDAGTPTSRVQPLPETVSPNFTVSWSGQDDQGGAGVAIYDVHVSEDGGPFSLWLQATTESQAEFLGESGRSYAFYSVAIDGVGHREAKSQSAETQTTVTASTSWHNEQLPQDVNGDGFITPIDALIIINLLNEFGPTAVWELMGTGHNYYDTNADDFVSPIDALLVINWLNYQARAEGEDTASTEVLSPTQMHHVSEDVPDHSGLDTNIAFSFPLEDLEKKRLSAWDAYFADLSS